MTITYRCSKRLIAPFATHAPNGTEDTRPKASIVVSARDKAVWAATNSVPSYTTDYAATWVPTNLWALNGIFVRG